MKANNIKHIGLFLLFGFCLLNKQARSQDTMPQMGPGSYEILIDDTGTIKIPFIMHKGKPLMQVEINGKKGTLMIDNGVLWDEIWLFGSPLVAELDLKPVDEVSIGGAGEGDPTAAYISENLTIFDYINNKIYLDPNENFDKAIE